MLCNTKLPDKQVLYNGFINVIECWVSQDGCHKNTNPKMDVQPCKIEKTKDDHNVQIAHRIKSEKVI